MCNSVNNTYKKHLPVYIHKHSSLIEPVEITALQIIIIIDPSEIHSPILNILIYIQFKKNQRRDTIFGPKYVHIIFAANTSFAGKLYAFSGSRSPILTCFYP